MTASRAEDSVFKCAEKTSFPNYNRPDHTQDVKDFVLELVRRADRDASSANTRPNGLKLTLKNPLNNDDHIEFRNCFYYDREGHDIPEVKLKLFRAQITQPDPAARIHVPATVQNHTLLILSCTKAEAFVVAVSHDPRYRKWDIELKELEGPFTNGQIIMDFGLRTISTLTDILIDF